MYIMKKLWIVSAAVVALSGSMFADTVTSATGTFSAFPVGFAPPIVWTSNAGPVTTGGTPFWNDPSDDVGVGGSHLMNVGYALTDTGGFATTPALLGLDNVSQQLTNGGLDPAAFNFVRNATAYNINLLYASSGLDTGASGSGVKGTVFGYYVGSTFTPLYTVGVTTTPGAKQAFSPGGSGTAYGFYATVCYSTTVGDCATYTTGAGNSGSNTGGAAWNHFALFNLGSSAQNYVIGFTGQNGMFGENIGDFQDVVIELSQASVPEPGTVAVMSLGLAALGLLGRRRFLKK
jgi:PEP-CTERM motif